jgi:ribose 5-phosphate isomerase A
MNLKEQAAREALTYVRSGMVVGLGTGRTNAHFVDLLGEKLRTGTLRDIVGVPTSEETSEHARALGIPLATLADYPRLDLAVDGADEVDYDLNLIKGLGRALLREKIVEIHAECFVVVVDESKMVSRLGRGPLPLEIARFGVDAHLRWLNTLGCRAELRLEKDGPPVITDNGNYMALCWFEEGIADPHTLARSLADRPGIVEHGLFLNMADIILVAGPDGTRVIRRDR